MTDFHDWERIDKFLRLFERLIIAYETDLAIRRTPWNLEKKEAPQK